MSTVKFISNKKKVLAELNKAVPIALEIIGGMAESYAKQLCPVDTGNLRNSITHAQINETDEAIGTNVEYAPYVELGTMKMQARPYLRPAAENHAREYKAVIEKVLGK